MDISTEILERLFASFSEFILASDNKPFQSFSTSTLIDDTEGYKYTVYEEARSNLGQKHWKPADIGSGKLQQAVLSAISTTVIHKFKKLDNNLIDWRKKDEFSNIPKDANLEATIFNFYKSKITDQQAFENYSELNLSYQFIAYLFFIKDRRLYLPISQVRFDKIFELVGVPELQTARNKSWDNYKAFLNIVKQARDFLQGKDPNTSLLDAHSFLWILGNQMQQFQSPSSVGPAPPRAKSPVSDLAFNPASSLPERNSYLFAWNPNVWSWTDIEDKIMELRTVGSTTTRWSCQSHRSINKGDRAFLVRLGELPRGIMASGYVVSEPFLTNHWSGIDKEIFCVILRFEVLLDPVKEQILTLDFLKEGNLSKQQWTPQASGISIQPECVMELEEVWFRFLNSQNRHINLTGSLATNEQTFEEGGQVQVTQTIYERNPYARQMCLKHYGHSCYVCDFNFEIKFGSIGKDYIHVHHLVQLAAIAKRHEVDPIEDLRPVCPNCHAMLHKRTPPLTIDELRNLLSPPISSIDTVST